MFQPSPTLKPNAGKKVGGGGRGRLTQSEWRPLQQARRRYVSAWLAMAESRASLARSAHLGSGGAGGSGPPGDSVLKILAEELLGKEELAEFKRALQHFRVNRSVASLCSRLKPVVNSTDKLILLLELSCRLPRSLQRDFHKLCSLTFHNYEPFLRYFNPSLLTPGPEPGSRVIAQDSSGQFQVVSSGFEKSLQLGKPGETNGTDLQSLPGTSATSGIYSEADDVARIDDTIDAVTSDVKNDVTTTSQTPARASRRDTVPNKKSSDAEGVEAQKPPRVPALTRAYRKYNTLSRHTSPHHEIAALQADSGRQRVLLKRREDGSLGVGIKGGREYGSPIVVFVVEPNSQAEKQGLQVDDQILDVNGTDFSNITHAEAVTLMRNAWNLILTVQKTQGASAEPANVRNEGGEWDAVVYPTADGKMGCGVVRGANGKLLISEVDDDSPAHKAGLITGDCILKIDGSEVDSLTDVQIATLTKAKRVLLHMQSRGQRSRRKSDDVFTFTDDDTDDSPASLHDSKANYLKATSAAQQVTSQSGARSASASRTAPTQRLYQPRSHSPGQLHSAAYYISQHQHGRRSHSASRQQASSQGSDRRGVMVYHPKDSKPPAAVTISSKERRPRSASRGIKLRLFRDRSPSPVFTGRKITVPIAGTDREVLHAVQRAIDVRQRARRRSVFQSDPAGEEWRI